MRRVAFLIVFIAFSLPVFALECPPKEALSYSSNGWVLSANYTDQGWTALNYVDNVGLEKFDDIMSTRSLADKNIYLLVVVTKYAENPKYTLECRYRNKGTEPNDVIVTVTRRDGGAIDFDPAAHKNFYPSPPLTPITSYTCASIKLGDCAI